MRGRAAEREKRDGVTEGEESTSFIYMHEYTHTHTPLTLICSLGESV